MEVRTFYLIVKGLDDWITDSMVKENFEAESNGERVEFVDVKAGTAVVKFACPKGILLVAAT